MSTRDKVRSVVVEALARSWSDEREHESAPEMLADAILAAFPWLADEPTDAEVEAGARAVDPAAWDESQWQVGGRENVLPESEGARAARDEARGLARAVLVAARDARTT